MHRGLLAVLVFALSPRPIVGQEPAPFRATWFDAVSVGAAGALYVVPAAVGLPNGAPSCAPCDPASLPGVDRWALRPVSATVGAASNLALVGVAGSAAFLSVYGLAGAQARGNAAVLANSMAWTAATTEWLKVIVRRKRPVLYTSDATGAAADKGNQESLPSGHASVAFAAATTYWMLARREHLPHGTRNTILLYAGAVGVAALRVAAGKHFPTDVLAGAALGSAVGWVVPTIHPAQR
jgi:membrane-associated phospholipid phosphatase